MKTLASNGPRGEPIATPSVCSYKAPSNWKSWFFVAARRRSIKSVLERFKPANSASSTRRDQKPEDDLLNITNPSFRRKRSWKPSFERFYRNPMQTLFARKGPDSHTCMACRRRIKNSWPCSQYCLLLTPTIIR